MNQIKIQFDGDTYDPRQDQVRLTGQLERVQKVLADGEWHTLPEIKTATGYTSDSSVSARIRDLRKAKFGGHTVVSRRTSDGSGLWEYRLVPAESAVT